MELFTLGLNDPNTGKPNYTQADVENSARALTGWQPTTSAPFVGTFNQGLWDQTDKTFLGNTGTSWKLFDIIGFIFEQPTSASAKLLGTPTGFPKDILPRTGLGEKIYKEFVYYDPAVTERNSTVVRCNGDADA